uniref:Uncharacterized protein n=1 Tax=Rhizophora mucronata TaxID=61149 RepID=A0A2P2NZJ0_RHIMU
MQIEILQSFIEECKPTGSIEFLQAALKQTQVIQLKAHNSA